MQIESALSNVKAKYELLEVIGSGAFGVVRKCRNRQTGELAAVKTIEKARVENLENLQREIELLREVHHPHIIELYDVYDDALSLHLVTELCTGGELYDKVIEKAENDEGHFSEEDAAILIRDILDAIRYIHDELNIVHRDLKPENFLLKDETDDADIKIIDFGLSRRNDAPFGLMSSRVGTPYYVAPEVLTDSYTFKCDIWSIGVITYILLCGFCPFAGDDDMETIYLVKNAALDFPSPEWDTISNEAKDFVQSLLQREPFMRPTAAEALNHPWIAKYYVVQPGIPPPRPFRFGSSTKSSGSLRLSDGSSGEQHVRARAQSESIELRLDSTRRTAFQKFLASLKIKKAITGAAQLLTPKEAMQLGEVFRKVDKDQDGKISVEDLDVAIQNQGFSHSVKENLTQMRNHLQTYSKVKFDIRPYIGLVAKRAHSDSTTEERVLNPLKK